MLNVPRLEAVFAPQAITLETYFLYKNQYKLLRKLGHRQALKSH